MISLKQLTLSLAFLTFYGLTGTLAATTCNTDLEYYPYCISIPDGASSTDKLPTVLMLQGRGARGPASNVQSLATYDGFGKLISAYNGGDHGEAQTLAATKFVVIVPVAPEYSSSFDPQYWMSERLSDVLDHVKEKGAPIDWDRFHCAGYSMGAFGTWRFSTKYPTMCASIVTSGGNAETNTITNSLGEQQTPPAELLSLVIKRKIPMRAFTATGDSTIPMSWLEQTQNSLESLGAGSLSTLTVLNTDHSGLSTIPFDANLLNWMLQQKRPGAKSSSGSNKGKGKPSKSKGKGKKKPASTKSSSASGSKKTKCTVAQRMRKRELAHIKRAAGLAGKQVGSL